MCGFYRIKIMEYVKQGLSNWTDPSGRSSRAEYWSTFLAFLLLAFISLFISETLYSLVVIADLFIGIGLGIRRMHDVGVSGWFILIPFVNFVYAFSKSEQKENKWGPVPNESLRDKASVSDDTDNIEVAELENVNDEEIEALEKRLVELQNLKKAQDAAELEKNSRKEEILNQIADLKKELDEQ